jgi:hypothetical protein
LLPVIFHRLFVIFHRLFCHFSPTY